MLLKSVKNFIQIRSDWHHTRIALFILSVCPVKIILRQRVCQRSDLKLILNGSYLISRNNLSIYEILLLAFFQDGWLVKFNYFPARSFTEALKFLGQHYFLHRFAAINLHKGLHIFMLCIYNELYWVESVEN